MLVEKSSPSMIAEYYKALTGKEIRTGIVLAFQSYGDFLRFNPHFHALILEGGFDEKGNFIFIPISDHIKMKVCFRKLVINLTFPTLNYLNFLFFQGQNLKYEFIM